MRSHSRLRMLLYLAAVALLGMLCGIFPPFTASPYLPVKARNVPPTLVNGEATEMESPRDTQNAEPPLDVRSEWQVRSVFRVKDYDERAEKNRQYLIRMGEKVFPAYEVILSDSKSDSMEVCGVFGVIYDVKVDRRRFLKHAISRFTDADYGIRWAAVWLLKEIGSPAEASPVVALLSDEHTEVAYAAAKALAAVGGPNEVVAMDVWLRGVSHREDRQLREHVQKCRDELKKRLDKVRAKDPKK